MTSEITDFDSLLRAARSQPEPQRLLFVFAGAALPENCTPAQQASFAAGQGGTLTPLMCVDKSPEEVLSFGALADESCRTGVDWTIVFVASLSGRDGHVPASADADAPLQRMADDVRTGAFGAYIPFDRAGNPVHFA